MLRDGGGVIEGLLYKGPQKVERLEGGEVKLRATKSELLSKIKSKTNPNRA